MNWPRPSLSGRTLAVTIVALAVGGAVAGTATGARVAAEAAPAVDLASAPLAASRPPLQMHIAAGRVVALRGDFLGVRTPEGSIVRVRVLPATVIRKAGKRVELA